MALTYGFFDATYDSESQTYDRAYNSEHFTEYFGQILGSGVCVYNNPDSMLVSISGTTAVVAPGYLFINGYWLKNDGNYTLSFSGAASGTYAVIARLDVSSRAITIGYEAAAESYTYALVLAYVTVSSGGELTATDTRADTSICGKIDAAGSMSAKVADALAYIENDIPTAFADYEAQLEEWKGDAAEALSEASTAVNGRVTALTETINGEVSTLNSTIAAEISSVTSTVNTKLSDIDDAIDSVPVPSVGEIKFSAAGTETGWQPCDGRYISAEDYPELATLLKTKSPSNISPTSLYESTDQSDVGLNLSNGCYYSGRIWVYSYDAQTLYGVDVSTGAIRKIPVTSEDTAFSNYLPPTDENPIALSIVPHKDGTSGARIFINQTIKDGSVTKGTGVSDAISTMKTCILLFCADFTGNESELSIAYLDLNSLTIATDKTATGSYYYYMSITKTKYVPYVISKLLDGVETYFCLLGRLGYSYGTFFSALLYWDDTSKDAFFDTRQGGQSVTSNSSGSSYRYYSGYSGGSRIGFSRKMKDESVYVSCLYSSSQGKYSASVSSCLNGTLAGSATQTAALSITTRTLVGPLDIAGYTYGVTDILLGSVTVVDKGDSGKIRKGDFSGIELPSTSKVFVDASAYVFGKDIYFFFFGSGILFTRDFDAFGFLDTRSALGNIVYFGYIEHSEDENELYILGQTDENKVAFGKIDLTNLESYETTGAFLPNIPVSSGISAYIKAVS